MNEEITTLVPEEDTTKTHETEDVSRRDFLRLAGASTLAVASIATPASIIQNTDHTFNDHLGSLAEDAARIATNKPEYLSPEGYATFYLEHQEAIDFSEEEWQNIVGPGLDKFFNLYFGKSLVEGFAVLAPIMNDMHIDKRNLLVAASFWGAEKYRTLERILLEDATNVAQTVISAGLDSNLIDKSLSTINPNLKPVQQIYDSRQLDGVASEYIRRVGSKRTRTVGPNDLDARNYAEAILYTTRYEELPIEYFGMRVFNGAKEVTKLGSKLDKERQSSGPSKSTATDYLQSARLLESQILRQQKELDFGLKLFTSSIRYREYLIQRALDLDSFDKLDVPQHALIELILITSMDDYPNQKQEIPYDEKYDGQFSRPQEIIAGIISDMKKTKVNEGSEIEDALDPENWPPEIENRVAFIRGLTFLRQNH